MKVIYELDVKLGSFYGRHLMLASSGIRHIYQSITVSQTHKHFFNRKTIIYVYTLFDIWICFTYILWVQHYCNIYVYQCKTTTTKPSNLIGSYCVQVYPFILPQTRDTMGGMAVVVCRGGWEALPWLLHL